MEEIFGLDTDIIMLGTLVGFLVIFFGVGTLAVINRIVLKIGLRNIPRRPAQTALIVVGLMLSTLIILLCAWNWRHAQPLHQKLGYRRPGRDRRNTDR